MKTFSFILLVIISVFYSCSSPEDEEQPNVFSIENQNLIVYIGGNPSGTTIVSGNKDYSVNNHNPDIVEVSIDYDRGDYGVILVKALQIGTATFEVTDNVCQTTLTITAKVTEAELATIIRNSNHPLLKKARYLCFKDNAERPFRVVDNGKACLAGKYSFSRSDDKLILTLTYQHGEDEATEVYDISESDYSALGTLNNDLHLGLSATTRMPPPPKAYYMRMRGINNGCSIDCIVSMDSGFDIDKELGQ